MDVIVNWIWQGSAIAAVVALALRAWPRLSATSRYRVWAIALLAVLVLPVLSAAGWFNAELLPVDVSTTGAAYAVSMPALPWWPVAVAIVLCGAHAAAVLLQTGRALVTLRRAKRRARRLPSHLETALERWALVRGRGRAARLVISRDVRAAAVLGLGDPVIAIAPAALRTLSADELDKIVLHEWAHVQRRDDIARLALRLVRAVAGLHPAVWWIDRQLDIERETACDDWAINLTGSPRTYALCLTKLASLMGPHDDARLMPAALIPSELTHRVMRLLDTRRSTATKRPILLTLTAMPIVFVIAAVVGSVELVATMSPSTFIADVVAPAPAVVPDAASGAAGVALRDDARGTEPVRRSVPPPTRTLPSSSTRLVPAALIAVPVQSENATPARGDQPQLPAMAQAGPLPELPGTASDVGALGLAPRPAASVPGATAKQNPAATKAVTPWGAAADASVSVGRGSQKAAVATAGFFGKLGKSIAGAF